MEAYASKKSAYAHFFVLIGLSMILLLLTSCSKTPSRSGTEPVAINFDHLQHLTETVTVNGRECDIVHIYANAPTYKWTGDDDEGIACVDDAARAARLYLREFELTGDTLYANRADRLLEFLYAMQMETGEFANFIWPDHTINDTGRTSVPSMDYWTARAVHALATAQRVYTDYDTTASTRADSAVTKTLANLSPDAPENQLIPGLEAGSDMLAVYVLALLERRRVKQNGREDSLIVRFAERIHSHSFQGSERFPYLVHLSWRNRWHKWGMLQVEALARAGQMLGHDDWLEAAKKEGGGFQRLLIEKNGPAEFLIENADTSSVRWFPQIAYGAASHAACQRALYDVTGEHDFAYRAELAAAWLHGNNPAKSQMYDPLTGRCFDGINSKSEVNRNSGAESTIEALLALQTISDLPQVIDAGQVTRSRDNNQAPQPGRSAAPDELR